jgi:hypothetical protein
MPTNQEPIARYAESIDRAAHFMKMRLGVGAQLGAFLSDHLLPDGGDKVQRLGDNMRLVFPFDIASLAGSAFALLLLSMPNTAALGASECDQESTLGASHIRRARTSQNSMNHPSVDENCRVVIAQFVEAVTARQAAATCENGASRRALKVIDAEIQTFNDRIAEQSCVQ